MGQREPLTGRHTHTQTDSHKIRGLHLPRALGLRSACSRLESTEAAVISGQPIQSWWSNALNPAVFTSVSLRAAPSCKTTISFTSAPSVIVGCQPSYSCALLGSSSRVFTSTARHVDLLVCTQIKQHMRLGSPHPAFKSGARCKTRIVPREAPRSTQALSARTCPYPIGLRCCQRQLSSHISFRPRWAFQPSTRLARVGSA